MGKWAHAARLLEMGWAQGCLLSAQSACVSWLARGESDSDARWGIKTSHLADDEFLIVVSQTCDLLKSPEKEPIVETLRAFWTRDQKLIREAGRNSVRHFLLRERKVDGIDEGLIADGAMRVQLDKTALLRINPSACFESTDEHTARRFRGWLGKRYQRPAIPDEHVAAIQRPIVNAMGKLSANDKIQVLLQGVKEILFLAAGDSEPYQVQLVILQDETDTRSVRPEDEFAELGGWLGDVLQKGGRAILVSWELRDYSQISVRDYTNACPLPLDHFSTTESVSE